MKNDFVNLFARLH